MKRRIRILDGGMGQELVKRAVKKGFDIHRLWSAKVLMDAPELVLDLHKEFLLAGASVITVSSYSVTPFRLAEHGLEHELENLQEIAVNLANQARQECGKQPEFGVASIAGCLSPVASYGPDAAEKSTSLYSDYLRVVNAQAFGVDFFLAETMGSILEASSALEAAKTARLPVWCAFSIDDDDPTKIRSGELLQDAVESIIGNFHPQAVLLNCSKPEAIDVALPLLRKVCSGRTLTGAYPNAFKSIEGLSRAKRRADRTVDRVESRQDFRDHDFADICHKWVSTGVADIVGGCCEITPEMIKSTSERLVRDGYRITS